MTLTRRYNRGMIRAVFALLPEMMFAGGAGLSAAQQQYEPVPLINDRPRQMDQ